MAARENITGCTTYTCIILLKKKVQAKTAQLHKYNKYNKIYTNITNTTKYNKFFPFQQTNKKKNNFVPCIIYTIPIY